MSPLAFAVLHHVIDELLGLTWDLRYEALEADWPLTFVTNAEGRVAEAVIPLEPQAQPIRFARSES